MSNKNQKQRYKIRNFLFIIWVVFSQACATKYVHSNQVAHVRYKNIINVSFDREGFLVQGETLENQSVTSWCFIPYRNPQNFYEIYRRFLPRNVKKRQKAISIVNIDSFEKPFHDIIKHNPPRKITAYISDKKLYLVWERKKFPEVSEKNLQEFPINKKPQFRTCYGYGKYQILWFGEIDYSINTFWIFFYPLAIPFDIATFPIQLLISLL